MTFKTLLCYLATATIVGLMTIPMWQFGAILGILFVAGFRIYYGYE